MRDEAIGRIMVMQPGKLGDMILTTPLFNGLRLLYPEARISVVCSQRNAIIARNDPDVDRVIELPRGPIAFAGLLRALRLRRNDLYVDPKHSHSRTSRIVAEIVNSRRILVHPSNRPRRAVTDVPDADPPGHFVDIALAPLKILAPEMRFARRPRINVPESARNAVRRSIGDAHGFVVVNISAGSPARFWLGRKWMELVEALGTLGEVVVLHDPADRERAAEICAASNGAVAPQSDSILEAAEIVSRASLVVSPDTSVIHLASAFNRATVGLFPPSADNLRRFRPLSDRSAVVQPPDDQPVSAITVDAVRAAISDATAWKPPDVLRVR